ncbi:MAG: hypothetical protein BAJALOKI1v1_880013 [Promethearchaeota archaeon]|nr:MAG: hypothetical protein BAJALOKI1v1_880013 [Candidatus Lokiarchaeota archaeon]
MENKYARNVYPIFYDEPGEVSEMLKQESKVFKKNRMPALLILDSKNVIQYAYYGDSMKDIPENDDLFEIIQKLDN